MNNPVICPVCQSPDTALWANAMDYEYFSTDKLYTYYHCHACHTIYIDPVPSGELKIIYPSNYYSFAGVKKNRAFQVKEWLDKKLFRKLLRQIKADKINILDIGGGTGWILDNIKKTDPRINITQVVDIDPLARQKAEDNGHLYFEGRIEEFKTSQQFHLILMLNIIEHISDPEKVMQSLHDKLMPDGIILIKTPNTQSLDASLFKKKYWGGLHCPRHWIIFSEKSFRILLKELPFDIASLKFTQAGAFWAFSIIIYLSRKKLMVTGKERPVIYHPLFPWISSFFAGIDFLLSLFTRTSQMFIVLKSKENETKLLSRSI
ncbi:MAG: bifunctional 3-demethylubiquinone-9 3-methyltransferase/2-octaprenyl-6-hydroxy phenol methylase, partial [Chitinophagaceae bacterium]|nr:bifunctional 3-demethylubiquinone-9 3-methyltransferase/2-octaprenyl-6-hydroxy phenol methylase [Chitinophagaceae bacterium]